MNHLLVDENLPTSLVGLLPVEASHARELGERLTDLQLWHFARQNDWVILTRDTDFFDRLMLEGMLLRLWPKIRELLVEADLVEVHAHALETFTCFKDPRAKG